MIHRKKFRPCSAVVRRQSVKHIKDLESQEKKTLCYKEQSREKVKEYQEKIKDIPEEKITYVDKTGIDSYLYREYGYSPRGQKIYEKISGRKFQRTSIVAAKLDNTAIPL